MPLSATPGFWQIGSCWLTTATARTAATTTATPAATTATTQLGISALPSCPCLSTSGTHAATQLVQSLWPEIGSFCLETRLTQLSFVSLKERKHVTCMRARRPCICGFMHRGRGREDIKKRRGEHDSMVTHTLYTACTMAHHLSNHANKTKQHQHKRAEGSTICRAGLLSTCDLNISCNDGT